MHPFIPHPLLTNPHLMTLFPRYWPRPSLLRRVPLEERLFQVDVHSRILARCHWHPRRNRHPALVLVHGLEGCTESHYMRGIAHKAWHAGFHVVRMNQRNCGGTEQLTPTLYNGGLSDDVRAVVVELYQRDGIEAIGVAGYSMGGNLVLKMAGEAEDRLPGLLGVATVCPNIDPAACVAALQEPRNWIYHRHFLLKLKARLRRKARLFPGKFDLTRLATIKTLEEFDETYTAPDGGYRNAQDYYDRSGARHVIGRITVPTLIITSQDDQFVPFRTFEIASVQTNPAIQFVGTEAGGHCGFIQRPCQVEDLYWAENRIVEFFQRLWEKQGIPSRS
ncbi:MAG: alpha/beta fold hydrolase [Nitrospirae bacterium]|nr:MAG: alpha/beta fold hydrolase [Nitrospirota bacterium]